jgi:hypothetical protein
MERRDDFHAAGAARIKGRARRVDGFTKAVFRVGTASEVGLTGVVGHKAGALDEFVDARHASAVATAGHVATAIQHVLNREINIAHCFLAVQGGISKASNLDTIRQGRKGAMRPTRSAVVWNVLIQAVCQVRASVHISPIKGVGKILRVNVGIRQRRGVVILNRVTGWMEQFAMGQKIFEGTQGGRYESCQQRRKEGETPVTSQHILCQQQTVLVSSRLSSTVVLFYSGSAGGASHKLHSVAFPIVKSRAREKMALLHHPLQRSMIRNLIGSQTEHGVEEE